MQVILHGNTCVCSTLLVTMQNVFLMALSNTLEASGLASSCPHPLTRLAKDKDHFPGMFFLPLHLDNSTSSFISQLKHCFVREPPIICPHAAMDPLVQYFSWLPFDIWSCVYSVNVSLPHWSLCSMGWGVSSRGGQVSRVPCEGETGWFLLAIIPYTLLGALIVVGVPQALVE